VHGPGPRSDVLGAVAADVRLRAAGFAARRADALQASAARRAEYVVLLHAFATGRTNESLLRLSEQALLRKLSLVRLTERLLRTHDEVEEEAEDVEHDDREAREVREDAVLGAQLRVAHGPEHHREVQREHVERSAAPRELHDGVVDECSPQATKIRHLSPLDLRS